MKRSMQPFQNFRRVTTIAALGGLMTIGAGAVTPNAAGQGFDKNPIEERLSADNQLPWGDGGDNPISRGLERTTRGLGQGESVGDAFRGGIREGGQTAIETPAQTQLRDRRAMQQGGDLPDVRRTERQGTSVPFYQDEAGRTFYLNAQGQRIYANQPIGTFQEQTYPGDSISRSPQPATGSNFSAASSSTANSGPALGVALSQTDRGMRVEDVMQNSVASKAGLQPGDVITSFNGTPIENINSLKEQIRQTDDQPVQMQVVRSGETQTLTATFGKANSGDRYQSAKPPSDETSRLKEEINQLRSQLESLQNEFDQWKDQVKADKYPSSNRNSGTANESNSNQAGNDQFNG